MNVMNFDSFKYVILNKEKSEIELPISGVKVRSKTVNGRDTRTPLKKQKGWEPKEQTLHPNDYGGDLLNTFLI